MQVIQRQEIIQHEEELRLILELDKFSSLMLKEFLEGVDGVWRYRFLRFRYASNNCRFGEESFDENFLWKFIRRTAFIIWKNLIV